MLRKILTDPQFSNTEEVKLCIGKAAFYFALDVLKRHKKILEVQNPNYDIYYIIARSTAERTILERSFTLVQLIGLIMALSIVIYYRFLSSRVNDGIVIFREM